MIILKVLIIANRVWREPKHKSRLFLNLWQKKKRSRKSIKGFF